MIWIVIGGLLLIPWFAGFLAQLHELELNNKYRNLYELPRLSAAKHTYNVLVAVFWFLWIWFPIRERAYFEQ